FRIEVAELDHGIPVLGAAVREVEHLAVNRDRLERLGLAAGPRLGGLKDALRGGAGAGAPIGALRADGTVDRRSVGELERELIVRGPGQVLGYLTDLAPSERNLRDAAALVSGADLLICEATFLDADRALAAERRHLTARQAGTLAREAGACRRAAMHMSPRYQGREDELVREAEEAFGGPALRLPTLAGAVRIPP